MARRKAPVQIPTTLKEEIDEILGEKPGEDVVTILGPDGILAAGLPVGEAPA